MAAAGRIEWTEARLKQELQSLEILRGVSVSAAWGVLQQCSTRELGSSETLLSKGQANHSMYLLLEGRLGIHLAEQSAEPIAYLEKGQTVGEMSVMDGSPASANVVAVEPSVLLEVAGEAFWRLANASHQFAINLLLLLAQRMRDSNSQLHRVTLMQHKLERDATVDALTGLYNRRWWEEKFTRILKRAQRDQSPLALVVVDVDRFKQYNDTYGHVSGDMVLRAVAKTVANNVRPTDVAARYGGEEFVVLLPVTDLSGAIAAAERVRQAVAQATIEDVDGQPLPGVTISLGISTLRPNDDASSFFQRGDAALYRAKSGGRNRVAVESV